MEYLIHDTTLIAIANAIRQRTGTTAVLTPEEFVTAIQSISGTGILPKLFTPNISLNANTLTITDNRNGDFTTRYDIYANSVFHTSVTATTVNLTTIFNTYAATNISIQVQAVNPQMQSSELSNVIQWQRPA